MPTASSTARRLDSIHAHLATPASSSSSTSSMASARPPITCHVLDTTAGRPGASIPVRLQLIAGGPRASSSTPPSWTSVTNADGRVTAWSASTFEEPLESLFKQEGQQEQEQQDMVFSLRFDTKAFFEAKGIQAFFPEVQVFFTVTKEQRAVGEHFHVPVLLGPYSYTTYRGS